MIDSLEMIYISNMHLVEQVLYLVSDIREACTCSMSPIKTALAMAQVMVLRRTGDKPLPEPMKTQLTDASSRH